MRSRRAPTTARSSPSCAGCATRNLGTSRLLDAIVEDLPSPVKHGSLQVGELELGPVEDARAVRLRLQDPGRSVRRADQPAARLPGRDAPATATCSTPAPTSRSASASCVVFAGKEVRHVQEFGPGDIGAVAKLKETRAGDWLADRDEPIEMPRLKLPAPVMAFAVEPQEPGRRGEGASPPCAACRRRTPRSTCTATSRRGEQIVAGLSQVHVEVIVDRLRERFGVEVTLKPPRVPYQETIRRSATAHGRHKKQSGGRGQFGDCQIEIEPLDDGADAEGFEFVDQIKGGVIPELVHPRRREGRARGDGSRRARRLSGEGRAGAPRRRRTPLAWTPRRSPSSWPASRR